MLAAARGLADETGALLVFDEVQCGSAAPGPSSRGRTRRSKPDARTLAKGLANGLPIGCLLVADEAAGAFRPGDHASTFGGNPVASAAACAVCDEGDRRAARPRAHGGAFLADALAALPGVVEVRGRGLLLGAELDRPADDVVRACLERGLLVITAGPNVLRLTPPLTVTRSELQHGLAILEEVLTA